jgi:hypothetical protein
MLRGNATACERPISGSDPLGSDEEHLSTLGREDACSVTTMWKDRGQVMTSLPRIARAAVLLARPALSPATRGQEVQALRTRELAELGDNTKLPR